MNMSVNPYDIRVALGAQFLDAIKPDWVDSIDLDRLHMESGRLCMIGQLFGDYGNVFLWPADGSQMFAASLGFQSYDTEFDEEWDGPIGHYGADCALLENAWRDLILKRRA
jgi:hypothetical protein